MKIIDGSNILDTKHKQLLRVTVLDRLKASRLEGKVSLLKVVHGDPASEFEDEDRKIVVLHLRPEHFSKPNIRWIICHEIQHRIDELDPHFGFDKSKKHGYLTKYGEKHGIILAHLWDIYIDGRLDKQGLYEIDPYEMIGIRGRVYPRDRQRMRLARINTLESGGVSHAEQVHDKVWCANESQYTYAMLAEVALGHRPA